MAKATQKREPNLARIAVGMGGILSQSETVVRAFGSVRSITIWIAMIVLPWIAGGRDLMQYRTDLTDFQDKNIRRRYFRSQRGRSHWRAPWARVA